MMQMHSSPLILWKVREERGGRERAEQPRQELWPAVIGTWWIQTNAGPLWDTVVHSRWRKLKSCNYVFLRGCCSDRQIFIKAHCSRCDYHMPAFIHHLNSALSSPLYCSTLSFNWAVWFSWHIDHHFCINAQAAAVGWGWLLSIGCAPAWRHIELSQQADAYKI